MPIEVELRQVGPATSEASIRGHQALIDRPTEKGGDDRGPMGGELLLASLGGCFLSNLFEAIRTRQAPIRNVTARVSGELEGAPPRFARITLEVRAEADDPAELEKLVSIAERSCIVSNTLRNAVQLTVRVAR